MARLMQKLHCNIGKQLKIWATPLENNKKSNILWQNVHIKA